MDRPNRAEIRLDSLLDSDGLARLLLFLDVDYQNCPAQVSHREIAELCRRLMLPYYEEARLYWSTATKDGFFNNKSPASAYLEATLRSMIEEYGPKARRTGIPVPSRSAPLK